LSYNKGAMVLHMLRFKLGTPVFLQGLKNYLADSDLAFGYASTSDLRLHLEAVSGQSLSEFFNDWVYGQGYPSYQFQVENLANNQVKITVSQTQSHPSVSFFEMPVPIKLVGSNNQQLDLILNHTTNNQVFIENVPFTVTSMLFDAEKDLITKNNFVSLDNAQVNPETIMKLYPNPASNILNLHVPTDVEVTRTVFYNTLGQTLSISNQTRWDVSGFASGIYFLKVFTKSGVNTFTFIKP